MYAPHFAAALAIKGHAPKAPAAALLTAAFLPDFIWIALSGAGIEPAGPNTFFDSWSHSILSVIVEASAFAFLFYRRGLAVWLPLWLAGLSHLLLDLPIHPKPIALYPHSPFHVPWDLWAWGLSKGWLGISPYWWIQSALVLAFLALYAAGARKSGVPGNLVAASCIGVVGLKLLL